MPVGVIMPVLLAGASPALLMELLIEGPLLLNLFGRFGTAAPFRGANHSNSKCFSPKRDCTAAVEGLTCTDTKRTGMGVWY